MLAAAGLVAAAALVSIARHRLEQERRAGERRALESARQSLEESGMTYVRSFSSAYVTASCRYPVALLAAPNSRMDEYYKWEAQDVETVASRGRQGLRAIPVRELTTEDMAMQRERRRKVMRWQKTDMILVEGQALPAGIDPARVRWIPEKSPFAWMNGSEEATPEIEALIKRRLRQQTGRPEKAKQLELEHSRKWHDRDQAALAHGRLPEAVGRSYWEATPKVLEHRGSVPEDDQAISGRGTDSGRAGLCSIVEDVQS
eukprot:SM000055S18306  [mRNA]  locus=s55:669843:671630:- [translate_table: standard]